MDRHARLRRARDDKAGGKRFVNCLKFFRLKVIEFAFGEVG